MGLAPPITTSLRASYCDPPTLLRSWTAWHGMQRGCSYHGLCGLAQRLQR
jgi:hypothetical protein